MLWIRPRAEVLLLRLFSRFDVDSGVHVDTALWFANMRLRSLSFSLFACLFFRCFSCDSSLVTCVCSVVLSLRRSLTCRLSLRIWPSLLGPLSSSVAASSAYLAFGDH